MMASEVEKATGIGSSASNDDHTAMRSRTERPIPKMDFKPTWNPVNTVGKI